MLPFTYRLIKTTVLPLIFYLTRTIFFFQICFFSWRPIKYDSVTPYILFDKDNSVTPYVFFMTTNKKQQCYPLCFFSIMTDDKQQCYPLYFIWQGQLFIYFQICFFSWRPINYDSVTPYILFDKDNSDTPYVFFHDDQ